MDENPAQGATLGRSASQCEFWIFDLYIVMQSVAGALSIKRSNGDLSVADPALFDFETHQQITATIRISAKTTQEVSTITINDVNEVDVSMTLWEGADYFSKPNEGDPTNAGNQDRITDNVWITREIRACYAILSQNLQQTMPLVQQEQNGHGNFYNIQT